MSVTHGNPFSTSEKCYFFFIKKMKNKNLS